MLQSRIAAFSSNASPSRSRPRWTPVAQCCARPRSAKSAKRCAPTEDATFVSDLDAAVERRLVSALREAFPEVPVLAEETENDAARLANDWCFVIDPIDGTKEFVEGRDGFSISVALAEQRRPVLGMLDFPPGVNASAPCAARCDAQRRAAALAGFLEGRAAAFGREPASMA
ncbi:MAG: inositol monophosphatase family protein [Bryobacterales bacterium]